MKQITKRAVKLYGYNVVTEEKSPEFDTAQELRDFIGPDLDREWMIVRKYPASNQTQQPVGVKETIPGMGF